MPGGVAPFRSGRETRGISVRMLRGFATPWSMGSQYSPHPVDRIHAFRPGAPAWTLTLLALASCSTLEAAGTGVAYSAAPAVPSAQSATPQEQPPPLPPKPAAPKRKDTSINALDVLVGSRSL